MTGSGVIERALRLDGEETVRHSDIVRFLSLADSYPHDPTDVQVTETHLSLIFFAGDLVFKMKRPILLDYVDFRTLARRRRACESEFSINQALAPGVYLDVVPITLEPCGRLALAGEGPAVEWLVKMRRLDTSIALDQKILVGEVAHADIERLCDRLAQFYRAQGPVDVAREDWLTLWREKIDLVRRSLTDPVFALPGELVDAPMAWLDAFLDGQSHLILARLDGGRIVDGHGDLKPEHVYFEDRVLLIDRLEFDERLRWCDPFDEVVFLGLECRRLGAPGIAPGLIDGLAQRLGDSPPASLLEFYRVYRACMRARLMIEHLRDEAPRTPQEWPRKAMNYLRLASPGRMGSDQS